MTQLALKDPLWLLALLVLPLVIWLRGRRRTPVLLVPFAAAWHRASLAAPARWPAALALTGLALLIVALARPQRVEDKREVRSEGYDLMLVLDLSGSMLWEDNPRPGGLNRLQVVTPIVQSFIERRPHDRIGLVVFGRKAYTLAPLTFDHDWLSRQLTRLKVGVIPGDLTAIGDGLGTALNRLEQAQRVSGGKRLGAFVVLLTDGDESVDRLGNPLSMLPAREAGEIARHKGVPIYSIAVGKEGFVWKPYEVNGERRYERDFVNAADPTLLRHISERSGGRYFRAEESDTIDDAFRAIDQAKKIEFQAKSYLVTTELFWWLAAPGLAMLALSAIFARPFWQTAARPLGAPTPSAAPAASAPLPQKT